MEKSDHIALTLSASSFAGQDDNIVSTGFTRKSLRRSWNRLPRCQRNLIVLALMALCVTLLLFLPGDQIVTEQEKSLRDKLLPPAQNIAGGALPFHINRDNQINGLHRKLGEQHDTVEAVVPSMLEDHGSNDKNVVRDKEAQIEENLANIAAVESVVQQPESPIPIPGNNIKKSDDLHVPAQVQPSNVQDLTNNIEEPSPVKAAPVHVHQYEPTMEDLINRPLMIGELNLSEYLDRMQAPLAQKQHFHGATNPRQEAVVAAFKHSWAGYKKYAWGHDNLKPISQTSHEWFGLGLTIVDSLDTMYIMGLEDEFKDARDWIDSSLKFDTSRDVNLFEVTIRVLGGLLAAYHLSGDRMFLIKSIELGNRLLPSFQSPSGIPYSDVNLGDLSAHSPKWSPDSSTSEVTTIQLEFRDLSRCTNIPVYEKVVKTVNDKVHALDKNHGLVPIFINANTGTFRNYATISLGARGDSYYEYLLKQWLQTGRKDNDYLILDYMHAIDGVLTQLMRRTPKEHHVFIGELINGKDFKPKMDHLTCYLPGTLLLGHQNGMPDSHNVLASDLLETCYQTYIRQQTKLAPEISYFAVNENEEQDIYVKPNDAHNLLRPEFIETLYYFYALTGDRKYQDMGWAIFEAFEKHTKVAAGYTSIGNVKNINNTRLRDMMESFWMSETLKYFYLLFSDNRKEIDLDKWVFNSEGHPLPTRQQ